MTVPVTVPRQRARAAPAAALGLLWLLAGVPEGAAATGDELCGPKSTADSCVITGNFTLPDGTALAFSRPDVDLRGTITVQFAGLCSLEPAAPCDTDAGCTPPARCLRSGGIALLADGNLAIAAGAGIQARGQAVAGDVAGPDGGSIALVAHDVTVAGTLDASAQGTTGVPAGRAGSITVRADGTATFASGARLDASTSRGGCGGSIMVQGGGGVVAGGVFNADGATFAGTIEVSARDYLGAAGTFQASNTSSDRATRPACPSGLGGGRILLRGSLIEFTGSAKAQGKQAGGGLVRVEGDRGVLVDSGVGTSPIDVSGGDGDATTSGGGVFLVATGGDVAVRRGAITANGIGSGFGSDSGVFAIVATGALRCAGSDTPCTSGAQCAAADTCRETGGNILLQAPLSAVGGAGGGAGCALCRGTLPCAPCEIRGTGTVTVSGPVNVGGGKQASAGKMTIAAGRDLSVGPGALTADAGHGGDVILIAGERAGTAPGVGGLLTVGAGTQLRARALLVGGFGGHVHLDACAVAVESEVSVDADGGPEGPSEGIDVVAHQGITIGPLAAFSALHGDITLTAPGEVTIAPDAVFEPAPAIVIDPTIPACAACGNGRVEPLEDCDGPGTCAALSQVCLPAGLTGECTCRDTCGTVPGTQSGEACDADDLAGASCVSLGFAGGTLGCRADCTLDTSGCGAVPCGDGRVGAGEACDPGATGGASPAFGERTCATLGFPAGGSLACTADCAAIVTQPHCTTAVSQTCATSADCPDGATCVAGCVACGNGFVDAGEECDDGPANGSGPNRCRLDCRLARCGDGTRDFPHCSGDPDTACTTTRDCPSGESCVVGEQCDAGAATCAGGVNDGAACCAAADCPGGTCVGDDCSRNRDDVGGCCRCDCILAPDVPCQGGCDDGNPCTTDTCDPASGCQHGTVADGTPCGDGTTCVGRRCAAPVCGDGRVGPGEECDQGAATCAGGDRDGATCCGAADCPGGTCPGGDCSRNRDDVVGCCRCDCALGREVPCQGGCDDGEVCTIDTCSPSLGCAHERLGYQAARSAVEASLLVPPCAGRVPAATGRLLGRARGLLQRAAGARSSHRATGLVRRALGTLRMAVRTVERAGRRRLAPDCAGPLRAVVTDALRRAACLAP